MAQLEEYEVTIRLFGGYVPQVFSLSLEVGAWRSMGHLPTEGGALTSHSRLT